MSEYIETLKKKAREFAKKRAQITERILADNQELTKLTAAEAGIVALLRVEGIAPEEPPTNGGAPQGKSKPIEPLVLSDVLKETLADGKVRDVGELVEAAKARGVDFGDKNPWRTVNFTLMGIRSGKSIERVDSDRWRRAA